MYKLRGFELTRFYCTNYDLALDACAKKKEGPAFSVHGKKKFAQCTLTHLGEELHFGMMPAGSKAVTCAATLAVCTKVQFFKEMPAPFKMTTFLPKAQNKTYANTPSAQLHIES